MIKLQFRMLSWGDEMPRVLIRTPTTFFRRRIALPVRVALCIAAFTASSLAGAQPSLLVEACNGLKNTAKKAQCDNA